MPTPFPQLSMNQVKVLRVLGQQIRARRKSLGVSAAETAEAAGMSRVTLHRIELGNSSVTIGAYLSVVASLGYQLELVDPRIQKQRSKSSSKVPRKIRIADYPQLKKLAWQIKDTKTISPRDALDLYERNWRHVDLNKMNARERDFVEVLLVTFDRERLLV